MRQCNPGLHVRHEDVVDGDEDGEITASAARVHFCVETPSSSPFRALLCPPPPLLPSHQSRVLHLGDFIYDVHNIVEFLTPSLLS